VQAAAARGDRALQGEATFGIAEGRDALPATLETYRRPIGLQHDGNDVQGSDFTVSYTWPSARIVGPKGPVKLDTGGAGKYAVGTLWAQWVDRHAHQMRGWTLVDVHDSLARERVPVTFELSYWDRQ
jgi:hypothetical protein